MKLPLRYPLLVLLCSLSVILTGCLNFPLEEQAVPNNAKLTWEMRQKQLLALQSWSVAGAVAVKTKNQQGGQLNFTWEQRGDHYAIDLTAPLGVAIAEIEGAPGKVLLAKADGSVVQGVTPEALFAREFHWTFPVSNLTYWIRGLPAANSPSIMTYDVYNHLKTLKQNDWFIEFDRYTQIRGVDVPGKLILSHSSLMIRLVLYSWA